MPLYEPLYVDDRDALASGNAYWKCHPVDGFDVFEVQHADMVYTIEEVRRIGRPFLSRISHVSWADIAAALTDLPLLRSLYSGDLYGRTAQSLTPAETAEIVYLIHASGNPADGPSGWSADLPLEDLGISAEDGAAADAAFRFHVKGSL